MPSYKQPVKERSRELIWNHAIESLTSRRDQNRILNASYMEHLWLYCQQQLNEHLDIESFVKWKEYADICYGEKKSEDLKIAFFCGNEPENDVNHLIRNGVRIENIYAFEYNTSLFKEAVQSLHDTYPLLKIYKSRIEQYAELQNTKFDIIYLDFTGPLIKEYKTFVKLLDLNALADMSVLIVNTCYPEKTDENIEFLTNFFYNDNFFEMSVYDGKERNREEGDYWFYRCEGCSEYGIHDIASFKAIIEKNFEYAYSAFQSAFLIDYANRHKASYEVFKNTTLANRMLKTDVLKDYNKFKNDFCDILVQEYFEDGRKLSSQQYMSDGFFEKKDNGLFSRLDAIKISEVFVETPYRHGFVDYSKNQEWAKQPEETRGEMPIEEYKEVDFKVVLNDDVKFVIDEINNWFYGKFKFCDLPMEHLWLELLLFQLGHPYHTNIGNHKRYSYTAKKRRMCIDIVTLDKCRALYDWIPMLEYFIYDMKNHDRQMISRMCIDAIGKQLLHIVDEVYFGAALVGINEYDWSASKVLPNRVDITIDPPEQSCL